MNKRHRILIVLILPLLLLCGCKGTRVTSNVNLHADSTITMEEVILFKGVSEAKLKEEPYSDLALTNNAFAKAQVVSKKIDGVKYAGTYAVSNKMDGAIYKSYLENEAVSNLYFKPSIMIKDGKPFMKVAKIESKGVIDEIHKEADIDDAAFKVNISLPKYSNIIETNCKEDFLESKVLTWENEDINDIYLVVEYFDFSGVVKTVFSILISGISLSLAFIIIKFWTQPKKTNPFN